MGVFALISVIADGLGAIVSSGTICFHLAPHFKRKRSQVNSHLVAPDFSAWATSHVSTKQTTCSSAAEIHEAYELWLAFFKKKIILA